MFILWRSQINTYRNNELTWPTDGERVGTGAVGRIIPVSRMTNSDSRIPGRGRLPALFLKVALAIVSPSGSHVNSKVSFSISTSK